MAQGYWLEGIAEREAVFHLYARKAPYSSDAIVVAGQDSVCELLESLSFTDADIEALASIPDAKGHGLFRPEFLEWLRGKRFSGDIDSVAEGEIVVPPAPMMRVRGPLWQVQWVESLLLNVMNHQSLIATYAAHVVDAAGPDGAVYEFGLRRAPSVGGAMSASRAAYIGGVHGTSNVLAGNTWGIPLVGTHAHSWILALGDETEAFRAYARALPDPITLLVDTWDSERGVERAIQIGKELEREGRTLAGIRLDSGDLVALSKRARALLDAAGMQSTKICVSNDLSEERIREMRAAGAPVDIWAIGTHLVTGASTPALGGVYKLSALRGRFGDWQPVMKRSEERERASWPGILQIFRMKTEDGRSVDVITDVTRGPDAPTEVVLEDGTPVKVLANPHRALFRTYMEGGQRQMASQPIQRARTRALDRWAYYIASQKGLGVAVDARLYRLREQLLKTGEGA